MPFGWEEFGDPKPVSELTDGSLATVVGTILQIAPGITRFKKLKLTQATLVDNADDELTLVWFNQTWVAKQLHKGDRVAVAGKVKAGRYNAFEMRKPHDARVEGGG